ncbi:MAG: D-alanine--D-alanine ligase [Alphaproteobacteria bacterium]
MSTIDNTLPSASAISMEKDTMRSVSFFEFWPAWVMYMPVALQWLVLSLRHRSLTIPFLANPDLTLSGMVGVPKSELMNQARGLCAQAILPWIALETDQAPPQEQADIWIETAEQKDIHLPFVCKPDIGCRGFGVKLVKTKQELANIIKSYPSGTSLICQKLAKSEAEVGIFYVKDPVSGKGDVVSMTSKFLPTVIGDGKTTLGNLIINDDRAGQLQHLYYERHKASWDNTPEKGEVVRLVFSASHSKGAIFRDARTYITPELTRAIVDIMDDLPNFYYGRLDVKYADLSSLQQGKTLEIIEINAASSESTHIWDRNAKFIDAVNTLLWQYKTLFRIGAHHRSQGYNPPSIIKFFRHWMKERELSKYYPHTD